MEPKPAGSEIELYEGGRSKKVQYSSRKDINYDDDKSQDSDYE